MWANRDSYRFLESQKDIVNIQGIKFSWMVMEVVEFSSEEPDKGIDCEGVDVAGPTNWGERKEKWKKEKEKVPRSLRISPCCLSDLGWRQLEPKKDPFLPFSPVKNNEINRPNTLPGPKEIIKKHFGRGGKNSYLLTCQILHLNDSHIKTHLANNSFLGNTLDIFFIELP